MHNCISNWIKLECIWMNQIYIQLHHCHHQHSRFLTWSFHQLLSAKKILEMLVLKVSTASTQSMLQVYKHDNRIWSKIYKFICQWTNLSIWRFSVFVFPSFDPQYTTPLVLPVNNNRPFLPLSADVTHPINRCYEL